jgi:superfamily II DNA or RNA helicase
MDQVPDYAEPLGSVSIVTALASSGCVWRDVPFTREGWDGEFPDGEVIKSLMGAEIAVRPETVDMPENGPSLIGLIRPTIETPAYITVRGREVSFHKAVLGAAGAVLGFACVRLVDEAVRVSVSPHPAHLRAIAECTGGTMVSDASGEGEALFKALSLSVVAATTFDNLVVSDFGLASALMGWGGEFFKADHGPIPADARWITVHPNGEGSKGVPVLVQPAKDNSGTYHVIGGAGGKLNMLKLRGVKSVSEYRQEHAERASAKRAAKNEAVRRDKELGLHDAKQEAREQINVQRKAAQKAFVKTVAEAMGWSEADLALDTSGLSPDAVKKAERQHHAQLMARAKAAVDTQRQMLVADLDARAAAGLGELPLSAGIDQLSVADLDPIRIPDTSGISHDFKARAEAAGLNQAKLDAAVTQIQQNATAGHSNPEKAIERGQVAQRIRDELASIPKPQLQTKIAEAKQAVSLIKAHKQLQALEKAAREANRDVDNATVEPKAYVLAASEIKDSDVSQSVEDDLRTVAARAFLAGVDDVGGDNAVAAHAAAGAYNSINALAQSVGGGSLMDRSVVDVLGVAGAAQVLARRLHTDFADQADEIAAGLEEYHVAHAKDRQESALSEAKALQGAAAEIEMGEAANAHDLAAASELNRKRQEHLAESRKVMGQALGEMEANAALIAAMRGGKRDSLDVSLGAVALDSAVKQLWALGLTDEDFSIERVAGNVFAAVKASGMDKLAAPVDRENIERVQRNLGIMRGEQDEADWLPQGFAKRADLGLNLPAGVCQPMAEPFDATAGDLAASLRSYIGGRTADGDKAADILSDIQSAAFFQKVGGARTAEYRAALDAVVPTKNGKKMVRVEDLAPLFDQYADDFAAKWGGARSTLNRQTFAPDAVAQDALHRALADEPTGVVAYKPIGDLSRDDRAALKAWFAKNIANESPEQASLREAADKLEAAEPERHMTDMFGEVSENPAWSAWKSELDDARAKVSAAGLDWNGYCHQMRGKVRAFESVQDMVRSQVSATFAQHYNTLRDDAPLKVGRTVVRNNLNHLGALDPAEREKRLNMERSLIDSLRERVNGKYASGSVGDKIDAAKEQQAAFEQAQMGFFASDDLFGGSDTVETPLGADERHTIGHAAESMIGKMMGVVGRNFEPGKPVRLFRPSMSGPEGAKRQRMIKLIEQNKRVIAGAGVGSGKTGMGLGAFSQLHSQGKVKKGLFVVPSIVQGQFGAEALRFLEAGKYNWHCDPGGSYADRLAAYKDPDSHFAVVTHQSFRDDVLRMAAEKDGLAPEAVSSNLAGMDKAGRATYVKDVLAHHGIGWDYIMADEAHGLLNREGKENSGMSNVIEGVTDNAEYYMHASGDPVKNDASEAFSLLQKMDGARYSDRGAFMRRYGGDTRAAKEGLQRELARHLYAMSVTPDVKVTKSEQTVPQSEAQQAALDGVEKQAAALRIAKMTGKADTAAAKAFAPSMFAGVPEDQHEAVAREVADSVGLLKTSAVRRVLDNHPAAGKLSKVADLAKERKGQQGVVFAHSLEAVENIRKRLEADGHRVVTISGKDSSQDKAAKIQKFNPDKGDPEADIIVCSDAGATGANLQSGRWLCQYDTPETAMTHAQRQGRINRIGQKNAVELIDLVANHAQERRTRSRLANKYDLRDLLTSPLDGLDDSGLAYYLKQRGIGGAKPQAELF